MIRTTLGALAAAFCFAGVASAQQQAAPPVGPDWSKIEIKTTDLGNRTYMLEGFGGNVTVAVGDDGVIMVDGQYAPLHDKLKAAIAAVTPQPVKFLVNTHHHGDHTGGNAPFAARTAPPSSRTSTCKHASPPARPAIPAAQDAAGCPGSRAAGQDLHRRGPTLEVKGRKAELKHPANAHTDGDTYVYFADANVLSTGDTVANGRYPNIDFLNGGNIKGVIAASDAYLALANDTTKIVPGHGPLATKAQLAEYRAMLVTARDRMAKLIAEGKSLDDVYAAKPFADFDAKWAANEQASKNWMRVVYNSLKQ